MIFTKTKLIDSCDTCKLDIFIKCLVKNDYSGLVIAGNPSQSQISEAWETIYNEYLQISENQYHKNVLRLYKEIAALKSTIFAVELGLYILSLRYNPEVVKNLKKLGFDFKFNSENLTEYLKDLDKARIRVGNPKMELKLKEIELERISREASNKPITETDFDKILAQLSKYQGFRLDKTRITVCEFVACQINWKKEIGINQRNELNKK